MSTKHTNPKDAVGSGKLPLELVPDSMRVWAAMAFLEGALKYGRYNWRIAGVRASIYMAACQRHLAKWWNGEDADPDTGVPHLASALACIGIIIDASVAEKLTDDRPPQQVELSRIIDAARVQVEDLKDRFADCRPYQYTIFDTPEDEDE